jgi:F-type H+-transporting ATPase subunit b
MIADLQRQLGIDASFFTQLLIFLVIFSWMQFVYFRPFLALIQRRKGQSGGLSEAAVRLDAAAARAEQDYAAALVVARKGAALDRERALAEARAAANQTVGAARLQAKQKLERAREAAQVSAKLELESLRGQVAGISGALVEKLTKTRVGL